MAKKSIMCTLVLLAASACHSASILWDVFEVEYHEAAYSYGCYELHFYGELGRYGYSPEMAVMNYGRFDDGSVYDGATLAEACDPGLLNAGNPYSYWVAATAGDIVTESYVLGKTALCDVEYVSSESYGSSFIIPAGEDFYIALLAGKVDARYSSDPIYCWLSLRVEENGEISLVHSAASDSPGLVVGEGPWSAIPEPTAGTLMLLGLAALALRRRKAAPRRLLRPSRSCWARR